ncbi:MAG TPA: hypothetical protein VET85_00545 [Stellaceae bacterium]|nr:hypothetical protein [Stellaceae bacterium]
MISGRKFATLIAAAIALPASAATPAAPDFSGVWARNSFNFEAPPSGPGPITNMRRVGEDASRFILGGDPVPLVGDYRNPILKPQAAEAVKRWGDVSAGGHDNRDPSNQCADFSPPFMLQMQQRVEIVQREKEILFLYQGDDHFRHVRLNESHPKKMVPSPMGHSVAHYDGDALVIDTVGIKLMPYTVADRFGTPQSEAMHVIERYRLIDDDAARAAQERHEKTSGRTGGVDGNWRFDAPDKKGLQIEVSVDDPNVFTTKWTGHLTYRRTPVPWEERVCAENNTDVLHQGFEHVPTAAKPDF